MTLAVSIPMVPTTVAAVMFVGKRHAAKILDHAVQVANVAETGFAVGTRTEAVTSLARCPRLT